LVHSPFKLLLDLCAALILGDQREGSDAQNDVMCISGLPTDGEAIEEEPLWDPGTP
jgi:hypothetical protein